MRKLNPTAWTPLRWGCFALWGEDGRQGGQLLGQERRCRVHAGDHRVERRLVLGRDQQRSLETRAAHLGGSCRLPRGDDAPQAQVVSGGRLGTNLVELGMLDLDVLSKHLSELCDAPLPPKDWALASRNDGKRREPCSA